MTKIPILMLMCVAATGCASVGPTPEQMQAMAGLSSSLCVESPGWNGAAIKAHYVSVGGKATGTAGGSAEVTCGASVAKFENEGKATAPKPPAAPATPK